MTRKEHEYIQELFISLKQKVDLIEEFLASYDIRRLLEEDALLQFKSVVEYAHDKINKAGSINETT